jgi:hypothetical protein
LLVTGTVHEGAKDRPKVDLGVSLPLVPTFCRTLLWA